MTPTEDRAQACAAMVAHLRRELELIPNDIAEAVIEAEVEEFWRTK